MTDQQRAPVDLDKLDALDNAVERCLEANRYNDASEALSRLRSALVNAYPDIAAELRAFRAERDKALADLGEATKVVRVLLGRDDRFHVSVGGNPIAMDRMFAKARALLSRLEGER